jgi:hypothetical protein
MNIYKLVGYPLVVISCYGMFRIISDYATEKMDFWPFGAEIGSLLTIALGILLIRKGNRKEKLS